MKIRLDKARAIEAKAIVARAFRNGPIEDLHAGKVCPVCSADPNYSRISDAEMKALMKAAVNQIYKLLWLRDHDIDGYAEAVGHGHRYSRHWDDPDI
ncbi:MAG: hypothetical protein BGO25_03030 [Acidobacteriales bacterium 59-55]|nr:hypothetical protein [Terriglobales bacterium]OJV40137.1 MAG: hypothetical protein BGO25_03030 [Acidobacteriales bacterium 59-55]